MDKRARTLLSDILEKHANKKIIVFGAGAGGQTVFDSVVRAGSDVLFFVDNGRQGSTVCGKPVKSPYDILYQRSDDVVVIIGVCQDSDVFQIKEQLTGFGLQEGVGFETARFNDLYAPIDYLDPILGYSRSGDLPGFKILPGKSERAPKIMVLGGSTTDHSFGGYKSWPELLHERCADRGVDIAVYNGAVAGYFSAQEMLKFIRDGLSLHPRVVVTFNGVNDALQQVLPGHPMYHPYSKKSLDVMFSMTPKSSISINNELRGVTYGVEACLTRHESWHKNVRIIRAVCREFDVHFVPFLQPTSLFSTGAAVAESAEKSELIREFYAEAVAIAKASGFIVDATAILDSVDDAYFDFVHYSEKGNGAIADFVYEMIGSHLGAEQPGV